MFKTSGRLNSKSLIKEGTNEYGKWQLVEFTIQKQFQRKKTKIAFVAMGKHARFVQEVPKNERITVYWHPKCNYHNGKWYTELKVYDVEKWVSKMKAESRIVFNGDQLDEPDFGIVPDQQLFDKEDSGTIQDTNNTEEAKDQPQEPA